MFVRTLGHAGLVLTTAAGEPLLLTDPWLVGSVYWRSWWLQNYPAEDELRDLQRTQFVYVTHSHPDHFHPPSLRALGKAPRYFVPAFPRNPMLGYLRDNGFDAEALAPFEWRTLAPGVRILSMLLWNDDSILLIDTPRALILNFNDAKPPPRVVRHIRGLAASLGKRCIVLSSYSPASLVNSFFRGHQQISLRDKASYARYVSGLCDQLGAADFMPFASQTVFLRSDSQWANAFKVTFDDLRAGWTSGARLLPPYTRLDLSNFSHSFTAPAAYNTGTPGKADAVAREQALNTAERMEAADFELLRASLARVRWLLRWIAPTIGFHVGGQQFSFRAWANEVVPGTKGCRFVIRVPPHPFREAVRIGHIGDLGITMFTFIDLQPKVLQPKVSAFFVYLFFVIVTLNDYGYARTLAGLVRWLPHALRLTFVPPPLPR